MALEIEYLEQAVLEAAAAAAWYAERSLTAAAEFEAELNAAELAIKGLPHASPPYHQRGVISCAGIRSASCIA